MNPAWNARQRSCYARSVLEAATGPVPARTALRIAYNAAWRILAGVVCLIGGFYLGTLTNASLYAAQTPCTTEDSTWCHWDAGMRGNGHGSSFTTYWEGFTVYER